jgi:TBC1 domain family protein 5
MASSTLSSEVSQLLETEMSVYKVIENLQRDAWMGKLTSMNLRALTWRLLLGILPANLALEHWHRHIQGLVREYNTLKDKEYPKIDRVSVDPLSSLSDDKESEEWKKYYKDVELCNFIMVDLDRLYMNGIDDEYFQTKERRDLLVSTLFLWAARNPSISYRQGMHEIIGPVLFCVEAEYAAFTSADTDVATAHPHVAACFNKKEYIEAHTYWIFERIMAELDVLYNPSPPASQQEQPTIVSFCTKVQEHFLRDLDPELCNHLEECFIQAQLYGMRWCRLLFGREISVTPTHGLRVWDYVFACCAMSPSNFYHYKPNVKYCIAYAYDPNGDRGTPTTPLSSKARLAHLDPEVQAMVAKKSTFTPLIAAVADMMLAMLLKVLMAKCLSYAGY